jgi:CheY-like chemotaxis protein
MVAEIDESCGAIFADPTQYHQILMNLCTNAYHAMERNGGTMTIRLYQETLNSTSLLHEFSCKPGDYAHLVVEDSGDGIEQSIVDRIYDPYFTTKESGKGTGMGLAIVYGIIQGHNGAIRVVSKPGVGTAFHVFIPISGGEVEEQEESYGELVYGSEHILLVDDDEGLLLMAKTLLERIGYTVTTKGNATDAFAGFCESPEDYDLVITDQTMPGMTGIELAEKIFMVRPEMPIILSTGYSPAVSREKVLAMGIRELAFKPLAFDKLSRLIRQVIDQVH